ncbi:MAG TPA: hypothetical protein VNY55_00280, partial [Mycobacterium sp.]|nr:hypothetical protein [Mycobacterium sp.]
RTPWRPSSRYPGPHSGHEPLPRRFSLPTRTPAMFVVGRAGKFKNLTLGLDGTNPRFPWKPSITMLTYRLTGTTEPIGIDHDEPDQSPP